MILNYILDHIPLWAYLVAGGIILLVLLYFFSPILVPIWNALPTWLKVTLVFIVSMIGAVFAGRYRGAKDERDAEAAREREAIQKRNEVDEKVSKMDAPAVHSDLDRWNRD